MTADANTWRPPAKTEPVRATGRGAAARISRSAEGLGQSDHNDKPAQFRRLRNGLARHRDPNTRGIRRFARNPYVWITLALTIVYGALALLLFQDVGNNMIAEIAAVTEENYGAPTEVTWAQLNEAYLMVTKLAAYTVAAYIAIFVLIDRLRPTTWTMKWLAFGWGATVAVFVSYYVNSWAALRMQTIGPVDPSTGARAAIYSAPFVEEAAKATILFALAILMRRRMVGIHQVVTLAGLSAVGFAFSENIVYYIRQYMYSVTIFGTDANAELQQIFQMRGLVLSFGHPLFTALIAIGMITALVNRSKLVRVLAPVAGYLAAAFGHMLFNGIASVMPDGARYLIIGGWAAVVALGVFLGFRYVTQIRNIRARLTEMVQLGWIKESDPYEFSRVLGRRRMLQAGLFRGPRVFFATLRLQRSLTELAYLRDAELRGTVDAMAIERERELILAVGEARVWGIDTARGQPIIPPEWGERWRAFWQRRREFRAAGRPETPVDIGSWAPPSGTPVGAAAGSWPPPGR